MDDAEMGMGDNSFDRNFCFIIGSFVDGWSRTNQEDALTIYRNCITSCYIINSERILHEYIRY